MNTNSENPKVGKDFESVVKEWFEKEYNQPFELYKKIKIGNPPEEHSFDISNKNASIVAECKCYTWTKTGNIPSAKMACLNEAVFYLSFLPKETKKYIVMQKTTHKKREETLAEHYYRRYGHMLNDIIILEYNAEFKEMNNIIC